MPASRLPKIALIHDYNPCDAHACHAIASLTQTLQALSSTLIVISGIKSPVSYLANPSQVYKAWDLAFNICEGKNGLARESQVPALLEAYEISFCFADAATMALTLDKGRTKMILAHYGVPTAPFAFVPHTARPADLSETVDVAITSSAHSSLLRTDYTLFAKLVGE